MFSRLKTLVSTLGKAFKGFGKNGRAARRDFMANRANLSLEQLEDRSVPAIIVNTNADIVDANPAVTSLREAVIEANAALGADTIVFAPGMANQTITLTTGQIGITDDVTIQGGQGMNITVSGNDASRIFSIEHPASNAISCTINDLKLINGREIVSSGGAIQFFGHQGQLTLNRVTFQNNRSLNDKGGAIFAEDSFLPGSTITINSCTFSGNSASGLFSSGGAIYIVGMNLTLDACTFLNNTAVLSGGAVETRVSGAGSQITTVRNGTTFTNNWVSGSGDDNFYYGGAIWTNQQLGVYRCSFVFNSAANGGGAIYYLASGEIGSQVNIHDSTFDRNSGFRGGAVLLWVEISAGTVIANVNGCLFRNNHATSGTDGYGGGMYLMQKVSGTGICYFTLSNSTFYQNDAGYWGGGIFLNRDVTGGGVISTKLVSLTVTQNWARNAGGGVYIYVTNGNPAPSFWNNIIAANTLTLGGADDGKDVKGTVNTMGYNLIGIKDGSTGWNTMGPWFDLVGTNASPLNSGLDPLGPTNNGGPTPTIRLLATSPGYQTGAVALKDEAPPLYKDQRGYTRGTLVNGIPVTSRGAYDPDATAP